MMIEIALALPTSDGSPRESQIASTAQCVEGNA
jgi:hypothetical protein